MSAKKQPEQDEAAEPTLGQKLLATLADPDVWRRYQERKDRAEHIRELELELEVRRAKAVPAPVERRGPGRPRAWTAERFHREYLAADKRLGDGAIDKERAHEMQLSERRFRELAKEHGRPISGQ